LRPVSTGLNNGAWTEIRRGELTEGQPVVVGSLTAPARSVPRPGPRGPF